MKASTNLVFRIAKNVTQERLTVGVAEHTSPLLLLYMAVKVKCGAMRPGKVRIYKNSQSIGTQSDSPPSTLYNSDETPTMMFRLELEQGARVG